jgi:hypothetical protein
VDHLEPWIVLFRNGKEVIPGAGLIIGYYGNTGFSHFRSFDQGSGGVSNVKVRKYIVAFPWKEYTSLPYLFKE